MTEAVGESGSSEQGKDGKVCRDCGAFKQIGSGQFGIVRGQCRTRRWNPLATAPACPEFKVRES